MPSLLPLLSSGPLPSSPPATPKKVPKKLRRRNPPPSLSTNHRRLPSTDSSTASLPKSRPTSSKSSYSPMDGAGWMAGPSTPHTSSTMLGRKSLDRGMNEWSPGEYSSPGGYSSTPPLPAGIAGMGYGMGAEMGSGGGVMTPPQSGSPNLYHQQQGYVKHTYGIPPSISQATQQTHGKKDKGKRKEQLRGYSYDSSIPASPPLTQPPYLGTAQYPNNMLVYPNSPQYPQPGNSRQSHTFPSTLNTNIGPPTPAQQLLGRTPNGSPILPPLPSFQSGGFGFDLSLPNGDTVGKPVTQTVTYPGRQSYKPAPLSPPAPPKQSVLISREPVRQPPPQPAPKPEATPSRVQTPMVEVEGDAAFHALTAEEPIPLSSTESSAAASPESLCVEFPQNPKDKGPAAIRKSEDKGSFLGGWKLALESRRPDDAKRISSENEAPVGVGEGGGWIHRRQGSFSSTRPPSAEKAKHKQFGQEYKEFRAARAREKAMKGKEIVGDFDGANVKMRSVDQRHKMSNEEDPKVLDGPVGQIETDELVGLDVAVRQMQLLEDQLKNGKPISPPDSRDGEKQLDLDRGYLADTSRNSTESQKSVSTSSSTASIKSQQPSQQPAPPPGHKSHKKTKSLSPLRNEINSTSPTPPPEPVEGERKQDKRDRSSSSSRHSANSHVTPPSEYLGKSRASTGSTINAASRPPTPPKPIAKLFVICCRCKYWHDLPSVMYRGMVENGGATRCPYCLHGMEVGCCSGYTCIVYMHQKHH